MTKLTLDRLEYLLDCHAPEPYSGRGMFGRQCLSVTTEDGQDPISLLADLVSDCDDTKEAARLLRGARTDSMGRETVIYWPGYPLPQTAT